MSRTDPYKKKRRSAKTTLLVYGEGLGEEMFLKYLKGLYAFKSSVAVSIKKGKGGTPRAVVVDADKMGDFDRKVVIVDNDKSPTEMENARKEAKKRGIELIENSPCLEALLLSILLPNEDFRSKSSVFCKSTFESKYIDKKKRAEPTEYGKIFPKTLLESRRKHLPELECLIVLMTNG